MKNAFTLAEILITLGIVGVVASMTLPVVIGNFKKQEMVSRLKKAYSIMQQAIQLGVKDEGWDAIPLADSSNESIENWYKNMFGDNMRVLKYCVDTAGCWNNGTIFRNGSKPDNDRGAVGMGGNCLSFITVDGYLILLDAWGPADIYNRFGVNTEYDGLSIYVDINGIKTPNMIGSDVFVLTYTMERGLLPAGKDLDLNEVISSCSYSGTGMYCLERIIRAGWNLKGIEI